MMLIIIKIIEISNLVCIMYSLKFYLLYAGYVSWQKNMHIQENGNVVQAKIIFYV